MCNGKPLHFLSDISKAVEGFVQCFVFLCEVETGEVVDILVEEARTGNGCNADFPCELLAEFDVALALGKIGDIDHHEVRAFGFGKGKAEVFESADEDITHMRVVVLKLFIVAHRSFKSGDNCLLQRRGSAHGKEVMHLFTSVHKGLVRHDIAEPPAGDGICF